MLSENKMLRILVVILSMVTLSALVVWNRTNQDNIKLRSRNEIIREEKIKVIFERDSLELENFILQTNIGRYETSLEYLNEKHPKAAKDFENYLSTQTE